MLKINKNQTSGSIQFPEQTLGQTANISTRTPLRIISLSGCTINPDWWQGDMKSPYWRLYINLDAGVEIKTAGKITKLEPLSVYILPAWLAWTGAIKQKVRHFNALFDLPNLPREKIIRYADSVYCVFSGDDAFGKLWLKQIEHQSDSETLSFSHYAQGHGLIWLTLSKLFEKIGPHFDELISEQFNRELSETCVWIDQHLSSPITRKSLSQVSHLSEAKLGRLFRDHLSVSPAQWIRDRRVTQAADYLRSSDLSIDEIAERCGLIDRAQMTKIFSKLMGTPPATFRRLQKQN